MPFETFKRQRLKPGAQPFVTIQKKGVLSLNRAAYAAMDEPEAVELLYDRESRRIGMRKIDSGLEHAYVVRSFGKGGTWLVSGTAFTNYYDIDTSVPTRRAARVEDGVLVVDLNDPGTPALSNRDRRVAELEVGPEPQGSPELGPQQHGSPEVGPQPQGSPQVGPQPQGSPV